MRVLSKIHGRILFDRPSCLQTGLSLSKGFAAGHLFDLRYYAASKE